MKTEKILKAQIRELVRLVKLKDKRIAELERQNLPMVNVPPVFFPAPVHVEPSVFPLDITWSNNLAYYPMGFAS